MSTTVTSDKLESPAKTATGNIKPVGDEPRFEFGKNWAKFLRSLDDDRMRMARESLQEMLGVTDLQGKSFLDVGSGSGLFSLAAAQLGADSIVSIDYDLHSVACTAELKRRFFPEKEDWVVDRGDCLDASLIGALPKFDVVYSWGVLHHTGNMWLGLEHVGKLVADDGLLFIAIYNDQTWRSKLWRRVKRIYCRGHIFQWLVVSWFIPQFVVTDLLRDILNRQKLFSKYRGHQARGMSIVRDWFDWLGGYPFEVARPDEIFDFYKHRGFSLVNLRTSTGLGCNEFVLHRKKGNE